MRRLPPSEIRFAEPANPLAFMSPIFLGSTAKVQHQFSLLCKRIYHHREKRLKNPAAIGDGINVIVQKSIEARIQGILQCRSVYSSQFWLCFFARS
jgi:hypothetical protein